MGHDDSKVEQTSQDLQEIKVRNAWLSILLSAGLSCFVLQVLTRQFGENGGWEVASTAVWIFLGILCQGLLFQWRFFPTETDWLKRSTRHKARIFGIVFHETPKVRSSSALETKAMVIRIVCGCAVFSAGWQMLPVPSFGLLVVVFGITFSFHPVCFWGPVLLAGGQLLVGVASDGVLRTWGGFFALVAGLLICMVYGWIASKVFLAVSPFTRDRLRLRFEAIARSLLLFSGVAGFIFFLSPKTVPRPGPDQNRPTQVKVVKPTQGQEITLRQQVRSLSQAELTAGAEGLGIPASSVKGMPRPQVEKQVLNELASMGMERIDASSFSQSVKQGAAAYDQALSARFLEQVGQGVQLEKSLDDLLKGVAPRQSKALKEEIATWQNEVNKLSPDAAETLRQTLQAKKEKLADELMTRVGLVRGRQQARKLLSKYAADVGKNAGEPKVGGSGDNLAVGDGGGSTKGREGTGAAATTGAKDTSITGEENGATSVGSRHHDQTNPKVTSVSNSSVEPSPASKPATLRDAVEPEPPKKRKLKRWRTFLPLVVIVVAVLIGFLLWERSSQKRVNQTKDHRPSRREHKRSQKLFRQQCLEILRQPVASQAEVCSKVIALYHAFLAHMERCEAPRFDYDTPLEFADRTAEIWPARTTDFRYVGDVFCDAYFGHQAPDEERFRAYLQALASLGHIRGFTKGEVQVHR